MAVQRAVIGWPRWTASATFTGGSWSATYPAANLGTLPLARVARSTNLTASNTKFRATLSAQRGVRCMALVRHNLSITATYRVRVWSDAGATVSTWDSGTLPVWAAVYPPDTLEWEADNWWSGTPLADDLAGSTWTLPIWIGSLKLARVIDVDIVDTANTAGYIEIGLFEISQGWQVSTNPDFGASFGHRFRSQEVEALGGTKYFERRDKPRVWRGQISALDRDEALANGFEHLRQADVDTPFLWFPYPGEPVHWVRTVFLARNVAPGLLAYSSPGREALPMSFEEVL